MSQQVRFFTVTEEEQGQRLDNYLLSRLKGVPKSAIYKIIRRGEVRINKGRAKPDARLKDGDLVRVPPLRLAERGEMPSPSRYLCGRLQESILFDRDGLLIVDKPTGLAVHGGSGVNIGLIEALRQLPGQQGFLELVHRLDKETSGCVMVARKRSVLKLMQEALRERSGCIKKRYIALVQGSWPKHLDKIDAPLKRYVMPSGERIVRVHQEGKASLTEFKVLKRFSSSTLVEASPVTGRTHQIRVHAQFAGCPLVGDSKYGEVQVSGQLKTVRSDNSSDKSSDIKSVRLFLHASMLEVSLGEPFDFVVQAQLPEDLQSYLKLQACASNTSIAES